MSATMHPVWTGHLKISLVTIPVRLFAVHAGSETIALRMLHSADSESGRSCLEPIRNSKFCPTCGPVDDDEIEMAFEYQRDRYVVITEAERERLLAPMTRILEVAQFATSTEITPISRKSCYWAVPDGKVAIEGYVTMRDAMARAGKVGVGRLVMNSREKAAIIEPAGAGLAVTTLRTSGEVHPGSTVFAETPEVDPAAVAAAGDLVVALTRNFDYDDELDPRHEALSAIIGKKLQALPKSDQDRFGITETPGLPDLMEAIKRSLARAGD